MPEHLGSPAGLSLLDELHCERQQQVLVLVPLSLGRIKLFSEEQCTLLNYCFNSDFVDYVIISQDILIFVI